MIKYSSREMLYTLVDKFSLSSKLEKIFSIIAPNDITVSMKRELTRVMHISSEQNQASI